MRPYFKANSSVPTIESLDQPTIAAYYKCDEASGNLVDATTAANNLTLSGTVNSDVSLFDLTSQGSRDFAGGYFFNNAAPTEVVDWAVLPNKSLSMIFEADNLAATQYLFDCYAVPANYYLRVSIDTSGVVTVQHDGSSSINVGTVTAGVRYMLVATVRQVSKDHFQLRGWLRNLEDPDEKRQYADAAIAATSGITSISSAQIGVGARYNVSLWTDTFNGSIDELVLWNHPLDETSVRELAKNYAGTTDEDYLYIRGNYGVHYKVEIAGSDNLTGDTFVDMSNLDGLDFVVSADIGHDIDNPASEATVVLRREFFKKSLSPTNANLFSDAAWTGLDINRRIRVLVAVTPADTGATDLDYLVQWEGVIHAIAWGNESLTLTCKDRYAALSETMLRPNFTDTSPTSSISEVGTVASSVGAGSTATLKEYGSTLGTDVRTVLKNMIDDNDPYVDSGGTAQWPCKDYPIVVTPVDPSFSVLTFRPAIERLGQSMQTVVALFGWRLAYRFDEKTRSFQLQLVEPDRDSPVVNETFTDGDYLSVETIAVNIDMIINAASVGIPTAVAEGETDEDVRIYWERVDSDSQDAYGYRWARIAEGFLSYLDSKDEALALADVIVKDLRDPELELQVDRPFWRNVELNDYFQFTANGIHFTSNKSVAIYGYGQSFGDDGSVSTRFACRGRPAAKVKGWRDVIVLPGINPTIPNFPPADPPAAPTLSRGVNQLKVAWARPTGRLNRNLSLTEVHVSTTSGFSPSSSTLKGVTAGNTLVVDISPFNTYYVKVIHKDNAGNRTAASSQAVAAGAGQPHALLRATSGVGDQSLTEGVAKHLSFAIESNKILDPKLDSGGTYYDTVALVNGRYEMRAAIPVSWTSWGTAPATEVEFEVIIEVDDDSAFGSPIILQRHRQVFASNSIRNEALINVRAIGAGNWDGYEARITIAYVDDKTSGGMTGVQVDAQGTNNSAGAILSITALEWDI